MDPRDCLDGCGITRPLTAIRSPDRPVRSESPYHLSYPSPQKCIIRVEGESTENLKYFLFHNLLNTKVTQWLRFSM